MTAPAGRPVRLPARPALNLADDTFVVAAPEAVAGALADPRRWAAWWPELRLTVTERRGVAGWRWAVGGRLTGTSEIWLEPCGDGVLVHYYLRVDLAGADRTRPPSPRERRRLARFGRRHARRHKRAVWRLKDTLEAGRRVGEPLAVPALPTAALPTAALPTAALPTAALPTAALRTQRR